MQQCDLKKIRLYFIILLSINVDFQTYIINEKYNSKLWNWFSYCLQILNSLLPKIEFHLFKIEFHICKLEFHVCKIDLEMV